MEEIYKINDYLPLYYKDESEREYIDTLVKAFEISYSNGLYQFAYIQLHMLFMTIVYFYLLKIHLFSQERLRDVLYYLLKDRSSDFYGKKNTKEGNLYFGSFAVINESEALLLLKIIGADSDLLGELKKLVKDRNDFAHANGNITITSQETIDEKLSNYLRLLDKVFMLFKQHISQLYIETIKEPQFYDIEIRESSDDTEQVVQGFIKEYFISSKELSACMKCDFSKIENHGSFSEILALHEALCIYGNTIIDEN